MLIVESSAMESVLCLKCGTIGAMLVQRRKSTSWTAKLHISWYATAPLAIGIYKEALGMQLCRYFAWHPSGSSNYLEKVATMGKSGWEGACRWVGRLNSTFPDVLRLSYLLFCTRKPRVCICVGVLFNKAVDLPLQVNNWGNMGQKWEKEGKSTCWVAQLHQY